MNETVRPRGHSKMRIEGLRWMAVGAAAAGIGVAAGAFGAHGLKAVLSEPMLAVFHTGVRYQMYHAFGLLIAGWMLAGYRLPLFQWANRGFCAGLVVFCGSLYVLSLTGVRWLGAVTPLGGLCFMIGWVCFALGLRQLARGEGERDRS